MRRIAIGLVVGLVVAAARPADACGVWKMADAEKQLAIRWLVNSGSITSKAGRRLGALYLDTEAKTGLRVVRDKKVVFDVRAGKLLRRGKAVGRIDDAGTITIGKRIFTVTFSDEKQLHDFPAWTLTVKRDDTVVITSEDASALCAIAEANVRGKQLSTAEQQAEIRRRVAFYLAWRELGA